MRHILFLTFIQTLSMERFILGDHEMECNRSPQYTSLDIKVRLFVNLFAFSEGKYSPLFEQTGNLKMRGSLRR